MELNADAKVSMFGSSPDRGDAAGVVAA